MISFQVKERDGGYVLEERDYPAQGISPFYSTLCRLSAGEALTLRRSRLFHFHGEAPAGAEPSDVGEILYLAEPYPGGLQIRLRLPADEMREAMDVEVPGFESMLETAAADPAKRAALVRNTGIADVAPAKAAA